MSIFLLRRLFFLILTLLAISIVIFTVTEILPGDVASVILGQQATEENLVVLRKKLGLNRPATVRYVEWIVNISQGDWGESLRLNLPVWPILMQRLRNSLALASLAFVIGVPTGILLGIIAGLARGRLPDQLVTIFTLLAVSLPEFVTGVILVIVFSTWLHWLPPSSLIEPDANLLESLPYLILPATTMLLIMLAHMARMTRSSMIEVMDSTAILKGLPRNSVIFGHALRNALLPTISIVALNVGWLMGGLIVVESVFAYPGVGQLLLLAIRNQDVPLLQAVTLLIAAIYTISNLIADLLYRYLNPRIRF